MKKIITTFFSMILLIASFGSSVYADTNYYNQMVTGYVASPGALTYFGTTPNMYTTIAVHPNTYGNVPNTSGTVIPYGSIVYVPSGLIVPGFSTSPKYTFKVEDMGDILNARGLTRYWFDIYFGTNTSAHIKNANDFGKPTIDYTVW